MSSQAASAAPRRGFAGLSRRILALGMLAAFATLLAGCSRDGAKLLAPKTESLTVALTLGLPAALVPLAAAKGYFADQGLEVTLKPMGTTITAIDAVEKGQADLAMSSETAFVFAVLDKKNVRLLATVYRSRSFISIVARRDRGISRPRDLIGKRIGLVPGTAPDYFSVLFLGLRGIEPDRITRVPLSVDQVEPALLNGDVDGVATWHPFSSRLIARLGDQAAVFSDPLIYQMRFDLLARPEFTGSRPDVARRFLVALGKALDFARDSPVEAKRMIIGATKTDPALLRDIWEDGNYVLTLDQSLLGGLEDQARWALATKAMPRTALPNFIEFIDPRPLASTRPGAVSILLP